MTLWWIVFAQLAGALSPPDRVTIPAGPFYRGAAIDPDAEPDERPGAVVVMPAFSIDRTEVTRAAYAACVAAGRCAPRADLSWLDLLSRLPMTRVSWREASEYCASKEARLPTENEWERAARGPHDRRRYPWGDTPDCARANFGNDDGEGRCPGNPGRPVEVGRFPGGASPEGVLDLAGNVWEWTADLYDPRAYVAARPRPIGRGSEELGRAPRRAVRGGACCSMFGLPRLTNRLGFPEDYRDLDLGFRCALGDFGIEGRRGILKR